MSTTTTTGTLAAGSSKTFTLAPGAAVSLTLSPNPRVTITETPESVSGSGVGGNTTRVHEPQLPGTFAYGPYAMGGVVVVAVASNSGSSVAWTRKDTVVTTDSTGTSLVSGDGKQFSIVSRGSRSPTPIIGDPSLTTGSVVSAVGTPALSIVTMPNGRQALRVACNTGENTELKFTGLAGSLFTGEMYVQAEGCTYTNGVSQYLMYATMDATRGTNYLSAGFGGYSAPLNTPIEPCTGVLTHRLARADWATTGTVTLPFLSDYVSFRIIPRGGFAPVVYIYGIGFSPQPAAGRVFVTVDDGYESWFQMGQPIMQARDIPVTLGVIPVNMDTGGGNAYKRSLKALINAGGAVVAHGPNTAAGVGSLFSAFADTASRVADMSAVRDWIASQGLGVNGFDSCYVWPQGLWQQSIVADQSLLDAAYAAGFTVGRAATAYAGYWSADAMSKYQRMTLPIIGHTWAGTTAAEATNITAITTAINNAATQGSDIILMLHRVQPTATADGSMSSIGIRVGDLITIADAIATKVTAGTLRTGRLTDLAVAGSWWAQ